MIYELKQYTPHPGKAQALRQRFVQSTLPIFARVGIKVVAVFTPEQPGDDLWYITAFPDEATRDAAWAAFGADAQWQSVKAASEADGPLLASQRSTRMAALSGAPAP